MLSGMWFWRHLWAVLGGLSLLLPAYKGAKSLVGWGGDIDFVLSRSDDPGWVGWVLSQFLDAPGWALILMIAVGLGLIWWDLRRSQARNLAAQKPFTEPSQPSPEPGRPAVVKPDAVRAAPQQSVSAPREPDWSKLFDLTDEGKRVQLRFLPDTENRQDDTVLLVVLGYKVMAGRDRAYAGAVNHEVLRALHEAPNSSVPVPMRGILFMRRVLEHADLGRPHVDAGLLRRVGLAQGGFYELTERGEEDARMMARDLIRRA
jgi:hypothetical protein